MTRVRLFISNFKKAAAWVRIPAAVFCFCAALYVTNGFFRYILVDDTDSYTRVALHELYHADSNIDVLLLGSSHCYRSLDPAVLDGVLGQNTFNAGSSIQSLDGSYAMLVEAGKHHHIQKVYLEMYYKIMGEDYERRTDVTPVYILSDYMKPSFHRIQYLLQACNMDYWLNGLIPARRNWRSLFEEMYVADLLETKSKASYKEYAYPSFRQEYYAGKGFVANRAGTALGGFVQEGSFDPAQEHPFSADDLKYLRKIIDYCKKHKIELTLFSAPMSDFRLTEMGDYDSYICQVQEALEGSGVSYYDFNLCRPKWFSYEEPYFNDPGHLSEEGAREFSRIFADFFAGKIREEELFYGSYQDKAVEMEPSVLGLVYTAEETKKEKVICLSPVLAGNPDAYVSISKKAGGKKKKSAVCTLRKLKDQEEIRLPAGEEGSLSVLVYQDEKGTVQTNEVRIAY